MKTEDYRAGPSTSSWDVSTEEEQCHNTSQMNASKGTELSHTLSSYVKPEEIHIAPQELGKLC